MNSRSILLMLVLALPLACGAQFSNRLDAVQWVQQGDMQLRLGNSEQALRLYTCLLYTSDAADE